ncbi:hypothetical protein AFLA_002570 [Aspergillus flavus NRRL3357]|nr:hypothetical protein AFLA_002570 [Aspergillus flavus NRRL3357]
MRSSQYGELTRPTRHGFDWMMRNWDVEIGISPEAKAVYRICAERTAPLRRAAGRSAFLPVRAKFNFLFIVRSTCVMVEHVQHYVFEVFWNAYVFRNDAIPPSESQGWIR